MIQDFKNGLFQPVLSEVVAAEIADAPEHVQAIYLELVTMNAEIHTVPEAALELADEYQKRKILSPNFYDDGLHIAIAT